MGIDPSETLERDGDPLVAETRLLGETRATMAIRILSWKGSTDSAPTVRVRAYEVDDAQRRQRWRELTRLELRRDREYLARQGTAGDAGEGEQLARVLVELIDA